MKNLCAWERVCDVASSESNLRRFIFSEFYVELLTLVSFSESVSFGGNTYNLIGLVWLRNIHFACTVVEGKPWNYIDGLKDECVLLDLFQSLIKHFNIGWFFIVYLASRESLQEQCESGVDNVDSINRVTKET